MSKVNVAVKDEPAPRWRAWIWFEAEIPTESPTACAAHLDHETDTWGVEISWDDGALRNDEVNGEVSWFGPPLKPGDTLRLCEGEREIGMVRILE